MTGERWKELHFATAEGTEGRDRHVWHRDPVMIGLAVVVALGVLFRIGRYFHRPSLWLDEAMLALNIAGRSVPELAQPLDLQQLAPLLFLWVERVALLVLGANEFALRLFPLLCGVLVSPLVYVVGRRLLAPPFAVLAAAVIAVSPVMIHFSVEAKPYASDVLAGLVLSSLALSVVAPRPRGSPPAHPLIWFLLFLACVLAPWFSFPSLFFIGAIAVAFLSAGRQSATVGVPARNTALLLVASGVSGAGSVWLASDPAIVTGMRMFFQAQGQFLNLDATGFRRLISLGADLLRTSILGGWGQHLGRAVIVILLPVLAIVIMGAVEMWRRGRPAFVLLCAPLFFGFLAAVLHRYAFAERLWLFAVPPVVLLFAAGIQRAGRLVSGRWVRAPGFAAIGLLLMPALATSAYELRFPGESTYQRHLPYSSGFREHSRPVIGALSSAARPGDAVYVFARAVPAWLFYTTDWRTEGATARPVLRSSPPTGPAFLTGGVRGLLTPQAERMLTRQRHGRTEILGVTSGHPAGSTPPFHPAWISGEVRRILAVRTDCVMLFFEGAVGAQHDVMVQALQRRGALERFRFEASQAVASRYCFRAGGDGARRDVPLPRRFPTG